MSSSCDVDRAVLVDTTAAVLNVGAEGDGCIQSSSLPPLPSSSIVVSPAKSRRAQWDKTRMSMTRPVFLHEVQEDDEENSAAARQQHQQQRQQEHDSLKDDKPTVIKRSRAVSSLSALLTSPLCQTLVPAASSAGEPATPSASTAALPPRAPHHGASARLPPAHPLHPIASSTAASSLSSSAAEALSAPYRPSRRQTTSLNSTYSHPALTRSSSLLPSFFPGSSSASPCPAPVHRSLRSGDLTAVRVASTAAAAVGAPSASASNAAAMLGEAAALVRNAKRAASNKGTDAAHKRRKSTETSSSDTAAASATSPPDTHETKEAWKIGKPADPAAARRRSLAGRHSVSVPSSARLTRQSLSMSHGVSSALRPVVTRAVVPRPPSSIATQTAPSSCLSPSSVNRLHSQLAALESQLSSLTQQHTLTRTTLFQQTLACEEERGARKDAEAERERLKVDLSVKENELQTLQATVTRMEGELRQAEGVRRRLHAYVEEMKGNVRVMVRVRPRLPQEVRDGAVDVFSFVTEQDGVQLLEVTGKEERSVDGTALVRKRQTFVFDRVFSPGAGQDDVYEAMQSLLVSVLDGYSALVFAYGQTGSGKSYTMEGPDATQAPVSSSSGSSSSGGAGPGGHAGHKPSSFSSPSDPAYGQRGVIQRSVEHLFSEMSVRRERTGWRYSCSVCMLELYNDAIRDLLVEHDTKQHDIKQVVRPHSTQPNTGDCSQANSRVDITVTNLEHVDVQQAADVYPLLERARAARRVGSTECNERSSRSHLVVRLAVAGSSEDGQRSEGVLHLIDLAGSERVKVSKADGARLKETAAINRSLSALTDVITALSKGNAAHMPFVPFRNSRLTHMLQPFLAGESKTVLLVNLSPAEEHIAESICSLRFAQTVRGVGARRR